MMMGRAQKRDGRPAKDSKSKNLQKIEASTKWITDQDHDRDNQSTRDERSHESQYTRQMMQRHSPKSQFPNENSSHKGRISASQDQASGKYEKLGPTAGSGNTSPFLIHN